jgi:hypothetical protein
MTGFTLGQLRELAKKHGKEYGRDFVIWAQKNGILKNPSDLNKKRNDEIANRSGFKNHNEYELNRCHKDMDHKRKYTQEWRHSNGIQLPMGENKDCAHYLGTIIAERQYGRIFFQKYSEELNKRCLMGILGTTFLWKEISK